VQKLVSHPLPALTAETYKATLLQAVSITAVATYMVPAPLPSTSASVDMTNRRLSDARMHLRVEGILLLEPMPSPTLVDTLVQNSNRLTGQSALTTC